jgi:L-lactate dehydrogenase complex protein LldG
MSARDEILTRVRRGRREAPPLPDLAQHAWTTFPDPIQQFHDLLQSVGGRCVRAASLSSADADLRQQPAYSSAKKTVACVPGIGTTNFDLAAVTDPHDLEDVDFAVLRGELAVAENGAVWVTDEQVPHRVLYFLPQHLALVVPAGQLVHNLHEAYARLDASRRPFGCWIAGPSKTADIEQSLVIGAHGARSHTVYLIDEWTAD